MRPRTKMIKKLAVSVSVVVFLILAFMAWGRWWYQHKYPYGFSHCCDSQLSHVLQMYAERHDGFFPAGEATPEASLSLLYREKFEGEPLADAGLLRGKTVPESVVQEILQRGELLTPETCGWHYVEGLRQDDDSRLAIFWDKAGLDHNGGRLSGGGHIVMFLDGMREHIPEAEWEDFLENQRKLLSERRRVKDVKPIGTAIGEPIDLKGDPNLEGIAFEEKSRSLYVLDDVDNDVDGDGKADRGEEIQVYAYDPESGLTWGNSWAIPAASDTHQFLTDGRGLALAEEKGRRILYTLSSRSDGTKDAKGKDNYESRLWRVDYTQPDRLEARTVDLGRADFDLRGAQVFDVACDKHGRLYISFDASKQAADLNEQRSRGILRFRPGEGDRVAKTATKILPANGKTPAYHDLGLTLMEMDGHDYLIGTVETLDDNRDQEIYAAEAETGRGLFKFDAPRLTGNINTERRLAYGDGVLWVGEQKKGLDQVQRVVIRDNLYEPLVGYKRPRRTEVTMTSRVICPEGENRGTIVHNFGRPLSTDIKPSQGSYPKGYALRMQSPGSDKDKAQAGTERLLTYMPLNDPSSRGKVSSVLYPASTKHHGLFKTVFEEDFWTREYRHFVYPHLANNSLGILKDTDFRLGHLKKGDPAIVDSLPRFHWTHQERIFEDFLGRVKAYIFKKYGVEADLTSPYWAARNISEYIRDNYNYPDPPASEDGSGDSRGNVVDYKNYHVANGPAVYKMIMTDPRFTKEDDIHRRRSGCMAAGGVFLAVMRYKGFPARWFGTARQQTPFADRPHATDDFYDLNEDGMFDGDDYMQVIHGHYTTEVYLGPGYGWQRFDATPVKPDDWDGDGRDYDDFARLHSMESQYEQMRRKVTAGHEAFSVASSLGVGYNEHFFTYDNEHEADCYKKSVYHKATGVYTSACKGGQGYDYILRCQYPSKVRGGSSIRWLPSLTFDVVINGGRPAVGENTVEFTPRGPWAEFEPDARVELVLRIVDGKAVTHRVLKTGIPWNQGRAKVIIPDGVRGKSLHLQVRKIGPEKFIGGASGKFRL